ncbi:winged helix DNA-binding domain-containing protein, partial [Clavulina sp. PMI_390]
MITDERSGQYIFWTKGGHSFMVSNTGEFSRTILGSHFKHNNFSSFVRQLNMYGFHKTNRTPRSTRANAENQEWEFSHPKFIQGRMDLIEEIKRRNVEPN